MNRLKVNFLGQQYNTPLLGASGTFGYGDEYTRFIDYKNLGAIVTKGLAPEPWPGNPPPRIAETPAGMMNSIGLQNIGVEAFLDTKLDKLSELDTNLIVNVVGRSPEEYLKVIERLNAYSSITAYEINISCPNVKAGGIAYGTDPDVAADLVKKIKNVSAKKIIIKLTPNVTSIGSIARACEEAGADALSMINTLKGCKIDIETGKPFFNNVFAGLSGPAIRPVAIAKVYEAYQAVSIPIIGIGGIACWQDVIEFILAGASLVQIGSGNLVDPALIGTIAKELQKYLERKNIESIENLIGKAHAQV